MRCRVKTEDFAAVILTYGHEPNHKELVLRLTKQGILREKIVVVHNPISPNVATRQDEDGVEIVHNAINMGYGGAINVGLKCPQVESSTAVFAVTDDVSIADDTLEIITSAVTENPKIGIFGTAVYYPSGELFSLGGISRGGGSIRHNLDPCITNGVAKCDWVDAAAWVIRSEVLQDVGLLEERYFMYFEEALICLKARRAGWNIGTIVDAIITQSPGGNKRPAAASYLMSRNQLHYAFVVAGWVGVLATFARLVGGAGSNHMLSRAEWLSAEERQRHALRMYGTLAGVKAAARSKWGPPPKLLPGPSDITATSES
jgi:N-acetylglucosaminyl-diphospho-decaprenol L-rhamnosyltransferase